MKLISVNAENSGGQTLSWATSTAITSWDVGYVDNSSGAWNRSTGVFTAPRDMTVWVNGRLAFVSHDQSNYCEYSTTFSVNSSTYTPSTYAFSAGSSFTSYKSVNGACAIVNLSQGDKLTFVGRHTVKNASGSNISLNTHSDGSYILIMELPDYK